MSTVQEMLARVRVVLVRPSHPGNIGACARAMKTMGLTRLVLVNPLKFPHEDANTMAAHSQDILESALVCDSLDQALAGTVYRVASTARPRGIEHEVLSARDAGLQLARQSLEGDVALLMGTEKFGLSNEEIGLCNVIGLIACNPDFSSLNLAAAVQVFAYEIRQAVTAMSGLGGLRAGEDDGPKDLPASHEEVEHLLRHWEEVLYQIDFLNQRHPKKIMFRLRRFLARAQPEKKEVRILRGFLTEVQKSLRPEALARHAESVVASPGSALAGDELD